MKKSEVIKEMVAIAQYCDGGYLEPYVADKLLDFLKSVGMLEPIKGVDENTNETIYSFDEE